MYKSDSFYIYDSVVKFDPALVSCWQVTCGDGYSYTKTQKMIDAEPKDMLCAVRTLGGEGKIITDDEIFNLPKGSLLILANKEIVRYLAVADEWSYIWYNFLCPDALPFFEIQKVYQIPIDVRETDCTAQMFDVMKTYDNTCNKIATLLFSLQFFNWIHLSEHEKYSNYSYYNEINECLQYIHGHLEEKINVSELAQKFHFSERHFRTLFTAITGMAPKVYQREQRLKKALSLLRNTSLPINKISDMLGYYSQFQLCRDFKDHYGITPTGYRKSIK